MDVHTDIHTYLYIQTDVHTDGQVADIETD